MPKTSPRTDNRSRAKTAGYVRVWWLALPLAAASFALIGWLASDRFAFGEPWQSIFAIAKIAVPTLILAWPISIMFRGRASAQQSLHDNDGRARSSSPNSTIKISWGQFELLVVEAFRRRGFRTTEAGSAASDGSRNLELMRNGQRYVMYCKQWRTKEVGVGPLRELNSMLVVTQAAGGIVVTSGSFTREAIAYAAGRSIQLIDGPTLREMLRDAETTMGPGSSSYGNPTIMPTGLQAITVQ
jgi:restriction system protein